jgi:hypothetical protein
VSYWEVTSNKPLLLRKEKTNRAACVFEG